MVALQLDPFLNELTSMFEQSTEKHSVWVTLKRSSLKSKVQTNKMNTQGQPIEYRCLIRATDGEKTISTSHDHGPPLGNLCQLLLDKLPVECVVIDGKGLNTQSAVGGKDHQRFQASYATILKAHMTALKKRERKDKKRAAGSDKKDTRQRV